MIVPGSESAIFHRDPTYHYPVIERGEGIYIFDEDGNRYVDGIAGAGNMTLGHSQKSIVDAMAEQASELPYCFSTFFTNRPALEYSERVAAIAPDGLNHVYFVSGGSEAVETAIKIARQYHVLRGEEQRELVLARWRSYHGSTIGALSVTGLPGMRRPFTPWLPSFPHIAPCHPYRCSFAGCEGKCNLTCADELERTLLEVGPENVAAFVAEPIVCGHFAVGVPPDDYFPRIREICDKYGVLFIADEVITSWGRVGKYFAIEHWNVVPDLIAFAKGASSGYCPLGGVVFRDGIRDAFNQSGKPFAHVHTYVNNPVAMRAGLAVLDIIEKEGLLEHVEKVGAHLQERGRELYRHPSVGDVRGRGLLFGLELVRDKDTREPFPADLEVHKRLGESLRAKGLATATTGGVADFVDGDDMRLYPPLIITKEQIDDVLGMIDEALSEVEAELGVR